MNPSLPNRRIAIIGGGISGLTCAHMLCRNYRVTVYEANNYIGGHTNTRDVELGGQIYPVNTGFIVYNDWTYPNFIKLMDRLGVKSENSDMSFSVRCENTGVEYNGTSLNRLFAQRVNLLRPSFLRMIRDILRFNKQTVEGLKTGVISGSMTLGEFVEENGYSRAFVDHYIVPMGAAIWSSSVEVMMDFPLRFFLQFFNNHGMLSVNERPQWRVISGGSRSYIEPLIEPFKHEIWQKTPVTTVLRTPEYVTVVTQDGYRADFDEVIFACHSDQALRLIDAPTEAESQILGSIPYQKSDVVLHTDATLMPKRKLAWASWNYHIPQRANGGAMVTYYMNMLQNFHDAPEAILVSLNRTTEIDENKIIEQYSYAHPVFTLDGVCAQQRHGEISGFNRSHFCGAYWFNGFHEDGVNSALRVAKHFGVEL